MKNGFLIDDTPKSMSTKQALKIKQALIEEGYDAELVSEVVKREKEEVVKKNMKKVCDKCKKMIDGKDYW